jgi:subtilisin family serine protease
VARLVLGIGFGPEAAAKWLGSLPFVEYAEPDRIISIAETMPNDPSFGNQWALHQPSDVDIDAPQGWDITTGSASTAVAVTDTGIDYTHPDLYLNIWLNLGEIPALFRSGLVDTNSDGELDFYDLNSLSSFSTVALDSGNAPINGWATRDLNANNRRDAGDLLADPAWCDSNDADGNGYRDDLVGWNYVANSNNPWDDNSHGSHVSGTIAAISNNGIGVAGVAWNARILPLKFLNSTGSGATSHAISAIHYASANGARVINASWGGGIGTATLSDAIRVAGERGTVFVAAAGNNASNNDASPFYPASYRHPNEIVVAAINKWGELATFSNYGATMVDLAAPGQSILSTVPGGYASKSGTSMAAPHVSGVVALLAGFQPDFTPAQLVDLVIGNAKPLAGLVGKTVSGGYLSAHASLIAAGLDPPIPSPDPPAPLPAAPTNLTSVATAWNSIQLTWTGSSGASGYTIEQSATGTSGWSVVGTVSSSTTTFSNGGLLAQTTYFYRVFATSSVGNSPYSGVASATTPARPGKRR